MQSDAQTVKEGKSPFGLLPHMYFSKGALSAHTKLVLHSEEHVCTLMLKSSNNQQSLFSSKTASAMTFNKTNKYMYNPGVV